MLPRAYWSAMAYRLGVGCVAAVVAAMLVAGCDGGGSSSGKPRTTAPQLHASVIQNRVDEGTSRIGVHLTNAGDRPVSVRSARLRWPGVVRAPESPRGAEFAPGQTIDLATTYGAVRCQGVDVDARPVAVVTLAGGRSLSVPVDRAGAAVLRRLWARDCARQRLGSVVEVALGPRFRPVGTGSDEYLRGELVLRRPRGSRSASDRPVVSVQGFSGSVLLTFRAVSPGSLPVRLDSGQDELRVPVGIGSTQRCDAHARGGSSQTFLLSAYVAVGESAASRVIVVPSKRVQVQAFALLDRVCG